MEKRILKKIRPLFTTIVTTMDAYSQDELLFEGTNLLDSRKMKKTIKEFQTVIAVGTSVRDIKVGDIVCIDPTRFGRVLHNKGSLDEASNSIKDNPVVEYNFDIIQINGKDALIIQDRDVKFIVEEFEDVKVKPKKVSTIYTPPKKHIIS